MKNTMKNTQIHQPVFFILIASLSIITVGGSGGSDTLTSSSILRDGDELVSALGIFALGFFSPANSSNKRYVAIWYNKIITHDIVWVANRNSPISEPGVGLTLSSNGKLLLTGANSSVVYWSSSTSSIVDAANTTSPIAQLLDTGNLVVRGADNGYIWQSFDYPTDTFLAGMKLGHDLRSGLNRNLSSWASPSDPSPGLYTSGIALGGVPQLVTTFGPSSFWRGGPWIGKGFSGSPESRSSHFFIVTFVSNSDEIDYFYQSDKITRLILNPNGFGQRLVWLDPPGQWSVFWQEPDDHCDYYAFCGVFGICNSINIPMCVCLNGFQPRHPANWAMMDWSGGCVRKTKLDCGRNGTGIVTDGFVPVSAVKLPDASVAVEDEGLGLDECGARCLMNCSCTGYSLANFTGAGSGCIMWMGQLYDLRVYANNSQVFYLRLASADLGAVPNQSHNIKLTAIVASIVVSFSVGALLIGCLLFRYWRKRRSLHSSEEENEESTTTNTGVELPLFDFGTISEATNNFSKDNELGEGGFGRVYMGKTDDGQEIAVKRLSKSSTQGLDEFKNEVMLVAKLQHRNLVRLLGCCVQKQEKMLIYEYMPNKSLDTILFDQEKNVLLNWQMRYDIIVGIARGLLYLHQDSAVRVIHRDLKASNILLDQEMVPKISDFGIARIFAGNEAKSQTKRVVGTYGYMSPEYVIDGIFSVKTDVFSFGVLTLEIISGQKNKGYYVSQAYHHLLRQAWRLWKEGNAMQLVDETIENSCSVAEVLKCIKIGLLCVQERPEERPLMSDIILMLASTNELLPEPKCPGFAAEADSSSSKREPHSVNNVTLTVTLGR